MIKVAMVGLGGMGGSHFRIYKDIENGEVIAVCEIREDMAKEKIGDADVRLYTDIDEMLKNEKPDMIDICTPSFLHAEHSVKALEAGFHVLCEKPMSINTEGTKKIMDAIEKTDKFFMTAHVVCFMHPYMYLKAVIDSGELGKLVRLDMKRISSIPRWSWDDWMRDTKRSGGTPMDLSIHDIDFVQFVLGQPKSVNAVYKKLSGNNDFIVSNLIYDDFLVSCEGTWYNADIKFEGSFKAIFQDGTLILKDGKLYRNGEEVKLDFEDSEADTGINITSTDGWPGELEYFTNCVRENKAPEYVTPESSEESVRLVERILEKAIML